MIEIIKKALSPRARRSSRSVDDFNLPPFPTHFDINTWIQDLARINGLQIELWPEAHRTDPAGETRQVGGKFIVCYDANTDTFRQIGIVFHEVFHILCGHQRRYSLLPDIGAARIDTVLGWHRSLYDDDDEVEAEMLASELTERVIGHMRDHRPNHNEPEDTSQGRLEWTLEKRRHA